MKKKTIEVALTYFELLAALTHVRNVIESAQRKGHGNHPLNKEREQRLEYLRKKLDQISYM